MAWCGLIGMPLGHSFSPKLHGMLADYDYRLIPLEEKNLPTFLQTEDFLGLNVTIPYKQTVIPLLDELSPEAERIGAVNTILRLPNGRLRGYNTDYDGFVHLLRASGLDVRGKKVLVLGTGGASRPVRCALEDQGAGEIVSISRTGPDNYETLSRHRDARILVNTTPVGMYPGNGASPLSLDAFPELEGVLDLIYNPQRTALVLQALDRGLPALGGLIMLAFQALRAAEIFTGRAIDEARGAEAAARLAREAENWVLIGMPGCGKSTIAAALARRTGREVLDADALVEQAAGRSIPEIFAAEGEAGFRARESAVLARFGRESGKILATGGGAVTQPKNRDFLRQNGRLIFLERDLALLPTAGRPVSQATAPEALYARRAPLYRAWADVTVQNDAPADAVAERILEVL